MKELYSRLIVFTAVSGFLLCAGSAYSQDDSEQPEFPKITRQPEDQAICIGSNVTFSANAENADGFQWMRNGVVMDGETNNSLTLRNVAKEDVGSYTCFATKETEAVPTRSATLNVLSLLGGGDICIFGLPILSGGSSGTCPGAYIGYVIYIKPVPLGWGWVPDSSTTIHTATDTNRTDTKVVYNGRFGDSGCNQTTVTVPDPTFSPKYRFAVYFTNDVPTNAYPIVLSGFNP